MNGAFRLLSHTADLRLRVTGSSLENLFRTALLGMAHVQNKTFCKKQKDSPGMGEEISIHSPDITSLLIDFLSEVLTRSHIQKLIYCEVRFHRLSDTDLSCTIFGNKAASFADDIKAVTYHEASVRKNRQGLWETIIVLDI